MSQTLGGSLRKALGEKRVKRNGVTHSENCTVNTKKLKRKIQDPATQKNIFKTEGLIILPPPLLLKKSHPGNNLYFTTLTEELELRILKTIPNHHRMQRLKQSTSIKD